MRKLLNNPWIVTALALVAVACVGISLLPSRTAAGRGMPESRETVTPAEPAANSAANEPGQPTVAEAMKLLAVTTMPSDPFASRAKPVVESAVAEVVPESVDTVRLSAIWTQDGATLILINGQIHQAGDEISRIKIESATQEGVWVAHWKGRDFLTLGSDFTLVTPGQRASAGARL